MGLFQKLFGPKVEVTDVWLVVGLGNPGSRYEKTRHNAGRDALLAVANHFNFQPWAVVKKHEAQIATGQIAGQSVFLFLPDTYMNLSGHSLRSYLRFLAIRPQIIIVHDDIDLPLGKVRLGQGRGAGGHNGVASVIKEIGTPNFMRLRLGVGRDETGATESVLKTVPADRRLEFEAMKDKVGAILATIIESGLEPAMNKYN
ncbi:MAG: aminoacyl-tRNA hydrolase [Candidatus Vogelbacteria bacterium RIFOXYD1_FULL_44_32]|uniref:Peptidyl-tRNA hydrolase n=1 Tax=Candidatus Vogelbacteria bacterium RIFOXYD1_FULL_44_32 TaxID=1802438 RepID=A0A1G2QD76_9BACT|nr:MAG: aminoacyl-tRNA hydrolase [Candidatus Vogelbacteria bacterium RIFOXYD1_FULL_44_32]